MDIEPFVQQSAMHFIIEPWQQTVPSLIAGFSTRDGGVSAGPYSSLNLGFHVGDDQESVRQNRERLAEQLTFPLSRWVGTEQVHEASVKKVSLADAGKGAATLETAIAGTDALYTAEENLLLTSLYADCVPLFFLAPDQRLIGLAHAGWRGTVKGIARAMVSRWQADEGVDPADVRVVIGPCISQSAYEVDERVIDAVRQSLTLAAEQTYTACGNDKYMLDLRLVNKQLLLEAGVRADHILLSSICTAGDERMFSHRADGGKTGRMMSFIGLRGDEE